MQTKLFLDADNDEVHNLMEVENLIESYFMLVDSTHQSLVSIGEYIDDTEDLINIQLDYRLDREVREGCYMLRSSLRYRCGVTEF